MTDARELARTALAEIAADAEVGEFLGTRDEAEFITSYLWASVKPGYPDWQWTVTVVDLPDAEASVMELELLPTQTSVVAPEWVPWSVRLAEYRATQQAIAAGALELAEVSDVLVDAEAEPDDEFTGDEDDELEGAGGFDDDDDDDDDDDEDDEDDEDEDDEDDDLDEEDLDEFGAEDGIHGVTLPGEEDDE